MENDQGNQREPNSYGLCYTRGSLVHSVSATLIVQ
jgi:hypothetical protein